MIFIFFLGHKHYLATCRHTSKSYLISIFGTSTPKSLAVLIFYPLLESFKKSIDLPRCLYIILPPEYFLLRPPACDMHAYNMCSLLIIMYHNCFGKQDDKEHTLIRYEKSSQLCLFTYIFT